MSLHIHLFSKTDVTSRSFIFKSRRHVHLSSKQKQSCVKFSGIFKARIYRVERIRILYFLALSHVARFYATTEQKFIHSFWNALRIRRKINQLYQSSFYTSSIYYITQNNPWIYRYRFNGKVFFCITPHTCQI
jgi:hypothetical protein